MKQRVWKPTKVRVPLVGQGTWMIERSPRKAVAALRHGIELGLTHIDTAEMYGSGRAEKIVAEAIIGLRPKLFLVSKVLPQNASYHGTREACEKSLKRLGTDYLDLYLLHWRESSPLEETLRAFEALQSQGKIRFFGVSNFDVDDLEEAVSLAGPGKIVCNQVFYHLKERTIEHAVLPWCLSHDIAVVGYSPYGQGNFPTSRSQGGKTLLAIANRYGATPRQVALNFLTRYPNTFTIPKASELAHVEENAATTRFSLTEQDIKQIDLAFPMGKPGPLPTL